MNDPSSQISSMIYGSSQDLFADYTENPSNLLMKSKQVIGVLQQSCTMWLQSAQTHPNPSFGYSQHVYLILLYIALKKHFWHRSMTLIEMCYIGCAELCCWHSLVDLRLSFPWACCWGSLMGSYAQLISLSLLRYPRASGEEGMVGVAGRCHTTSVPVLYMTGVCLHEQCNAHRGPMTWAAGLHEKVCQGLNILLFWPIKSY